MSDDFPTQRFPQQGDTPTEQISTGEVYEELGEEKQKSRGLLIGLIVAGVLLLVAVIVLVIILLPKGQGDPTATPSLTPPASDTPAPSDTPTPEPTETEAPPPAPAGPTVDSFSTGTTTVACDADNGLTISWSTTGGVRVYFGVDTNDASTNPFFDNLPLSGNSNDNFPAGYAPFTYSCGSPQHVYTITVVDANGNKASKSVTVTDLNA